MILLSTSDHPVVSLGSLSILADLIVHQCCHSCPGNENFQTTWELASSGLLLRVYYQSNKKSETSLEYLIFFAILNCPKISFGTVFMEPVMKHDLVPEEMLGVI